MFPTGAANRIALASPEPGDFWVERYSCPYFLVVAVDGDKYTVLSCMGTGPGRENDKHAMITNVENWSFDYSQSMVVDQAWMNKAVKYATMDKFVADVVRAGTKHSISVIVSEWREYKSIEMKAEISQKQSEWETFTGWTALKETA